MLTLLTVAALVAPALPPRPWAGQSPRLLIIEHTYDGPRESGGDLLALRYLGPLVVIEWGDLGADGLFRSGFDPAPEQPTPYLPNRHEDSPP